MPVGATVRLRQCLSCCQDGLATYAEQPLPAPDQADSVQPRAVCGALIRVVPPTAIVELGSVQWDVEVFGGDVLAF